jgi:chromosome segregation ATPase
MKRLVAEHIAKTADRLDDLGSKHGALQRQADHTDATVEPLTQELVSLRYQVEALAARPTADTSLPGRVSDLTSAVADGLRQSCDSAKLLTARIEGCEAFAEHTETRHSMITQQLSALSSELPLLALKIESLIPELAALRNEQVAASAALAEQISDGRIKVP